MARVLSICLIRGDISNDIFGYDVHKAFHFEKNGVIGGLDFEADIGQVEETIADRIDAETNLPSGRKEDGTNKKGQSM